MTGFDLGMAIGLMIFAGALLVRIDKGMSERELRAFHMKQARKRARLMQQVAK